MYHRDRARFVIHILDDIPGTDNDLISNGLHVTVAKYRLLHRPKRAWTNENGLMYYPSPSEVSVTLRGVSDDVLRYKMVQSRIPRRIL